MVSYPCVIENRSQLRIRRIATLFQMGIWVEEVTIGGRPHALQLDSPTITPELTRFARCLVLLSQVFKLPLSHINIVWEDTQRIAYNWNRSLFFNLCYAEVLMNAGKLPLEMMDFWYPIVCHELAHNSYSAHNAEHSRATEALISAKMAQFFELRQFIKTSCSTWDLIVQNQQPGQY